MSFTTLSYLALLLVVFASYWLVGARRAQNAILVVASYLFYAWWDYRFCGLMLVSTLVDYGVGIGLGATVQDRRRKVLLWISLVTNLGMLGFFKYFDFFADSAVLLADSIGWHLSPVTLDLVLPVGISFYTFQTLSYSIDVYRRQLTPCRSLLNYSTYVSFFPQLVAGPIERGKQLLPQFERPRTFSLTESTDGCRLLLWGFFQKMVLADRAALLVDPVYADVHRYDGSTLIVATLVFAFQIYFDFSAYSNIAIGTARLLGIDLMRNFAYPYFSQDMGEFWRRWHISLSTWFRDYVYIPLGGSRVRPLRQALNVFATFTLSGLWHGASWNFVVWGALNGAMILPRALTPGGVARHATDMPGGNSWFPRPLTLLRMAFTFGLACVGWVFFRSPTLGDAAAVFSRVSVGNGVSGQGLGRYLTQAHTETLTLIALAVLAEWLTRAHCHPLGLSTRHRWLRWLVYSIVLWATLIFAAPRSGPFIYFQF